MKKKMFDKFQVGVFVIMKNLINRMRYIDKLHTVFILIFIFSFCGGSKKPGNPGNPPGDNIPPVVSVSIGETEVFKEEILLNVLAIDDKGLKAYLISEDSTRPDIDDERWVFVEGEPIKFKNEKLKILFDNNPGEKRLNVWVRDIAGNISDPQMVTFTYKLNPQTVPVVPMDPGSPDGPQNPSVIISLGEENSTSSSVNLALSASDDDGVSGYYISESYTPPSLEVEGWNDYKNEVNYTFMSDPDSGKIEIGMKTVYVWFKDSKGNISARASDSINYTGSPSGGQNGLPTGGNGSSEGPQNPSVIISLGEESTTSSSVNLSLSATDDDVVSGYFISETYTPPTQESEGWKNYEPNVSYVFKTDPMTGIIEKGTKTIYVWFKDSKGNISARVSDSINYTGLSDGGGGGDGTTIPGGNGSSEGPQNPSVIINLGEESTTNSNLILSLSAEDNDGVTGIYISEVSTPPTIETIGWSDYQNNVTYILRSNPNTGNVVAEMKTIYVWFKDGKGNISAGVSDSINFTVLSTGTGGGAGLPTDIGSPNGGGQDSSAIPVDNGSPDGPQNLSVMINIGEESTSSTSVIISLSANDEDGMAGYYISEDYHTPTLDLSEWNEYVSGFSYVFKADTNTGKVEAGMKTVYVWFKDSKGNISARISDSINYIVNSSGGGTGLPTDMGF